jgi:uncharacterized protein (DUF983 family)
MQAGRIQQTEVAMDTCPKCGERAVVPFLAAKKRCKACGAYIDIVDLLTRRAPPK